MKHLAGQYFLNSDLRREELIIQAEKLCEAGYEIIYLHARAGLKTPYLSRQWFEALKIVTEVLKTHGVQFAIWDEDNYPSGVAGNRIVNRYPELAASVLNFTVVEAEAGKCCRKMLTPHGDLLRCFFIDETGRQLDITDECGTLRDTWGPAYINYSAYSPHSLIPLRHRRRGMNDVRRFAVEYTPEVNGKIMAVEILHPDCGHNTDLLNPETTKKFIEFTFDPYTAIWGKDGLKKECFGSFLDEPSLAGPFPWTRNMPEIFAAKYGYDLLEKLPHLFMDLDGTSEKIRLDYRETIRDLLSRNYLLLLKKDLNQRGLKSTGHLSRSEWLSYANTMWPDEMRIFRELDIPCCDPLGGAIGRRGAIAHHIGIKAVSSAARLFGKEAAGADCFAVGGDTVSLRDLKFMLDYHLVMGITWYNVHGLYYTLEAERRDEAPPSLFYQHSQWPHMKEFCSYLKRRCEELSGEHLCDIELLYPSAMLESRIPGTPEPDPALHETAEFLVSHQQDFELIDEVTLAEQNPAGFAKLRPCFVVAHTTVIQESTEVFLKRYNGAGGRVIVTGVMPRIIGSSRIADLGRITEDIASALPPSLLAGSGSEDVLIRRIRKDGRERCYFFNRADTEFKGSWDGMPLVIPAGGAGFAEELAPVPELPQLRPDHWKVTCQKNCVPLRFWEYCGGKIDLFIPRRNVTEQFQETELFSCRFSAEQRVKAELVSEEASLAAGTYFLNGKELSCWHKAEFRDCRERCTDLEGLLTDGENVLEYHGMLPENAPYLRGSFSVNSNDGSPVMEKWKMPLETGHTVDLAQLGMPSFSGTVQCETEVKTTVPGVHQLCLNRLYGSARLTVDGQDMGIRITSPAVWQMDLKPGVHMLALELCNAPGNRDVMSGEPAGFQRSDLPVRIS